MNPELVESLQETAITNDVPGSILHDFQFLLEYVDEIAPTLTKNHLLTLRDLTPLNQNLHRRIKHGLTRPVQKSFPHINGLFLLLRASGLTVVDVGDRKPTLRTDAAVLQSWHALNPDERYFTLLESWLMRGDAGIIAERSGRFELEPRSSSGPSFTPCCSRTDGMTMTGSSGPDIVLACTIWP